MTIYRASFGPKYQCILGFLEGFKRILDVGCGAGNFSARLLEQHDVLGVDADKENFLVAKEKIPVLLGDFLKIKIDREFDVVLFGDVLEHMYQPEEALKKAKSLAPRIVLCVPNFDCIFAKLMRGIGIKKTKTGILDETHVYYFNKEIIESMIKGLGLIILKEASPHPRKLPPIYQKLINWWPELFGIQFIYLCMVGAKD